MTGTGDEDCVDVALADDAVHVRVDEVQPRRRPPVPKSAENDVSAARVFLAAERELDAALDDVIHRE